MRWSVGGDSGGASGLTKIQCSPTSDGAGAAIIVSERFVNRARCWDRAIEITGQAMVTDLASSFSAGTDCDAWPWSSRTATT
jgi:acetyl-CoA acyltransferase